MNNVEIMVHNTYTIVKHLIHFVKHFYCLNYDFSQDKVTCLKSTSSLVILNFRRSHLCKYV